MKLYGSCMECRTEVLLSEPPRFDTYCEAHERVGDLERTVDALLAAVLAGDAATVDRLCSDLDHAATAAQTTSATVAAVAYASRGWPVFPVAAGSKLPAISKKDGGKGVLDATTDIDRIKAYWNKHPRTNIGVATGHMFDVVDVDWEKPGAANSWVTVREDDEVEVHALVSTPRGVHAYVEPSGFGNRANMAPGIDYRGIGGYVVAPPSTVTDRGSYTWWSKPSPRILNSKDK